MGSVSNIFVSVLLYSAIIYISWAQQKNTKQYNKKGSSLPSQLQSPTIRRNVRSDFSLINHVHQLQSSENVLSLPEFTDLGKKELHENIKAIIVTKKIPVPYAVHVEKKIPFPVRIPIRRPFTVFIPKPYLVELHKPFPFPIKVPVPQPYAVEKHIPIPYKVPVDKPYPVHISKPYPVIIEKKVPVPIEKQIPVPVNIPVDRPYPVHIPVEKPVLYPVEKHVPIPIKIPVDRPIPVPIEKPIPVPVSHPPITDKTQFTEYLQDSALLSSENNLKSSLSNFQPSAYDPIAHGLTNSATGKTVSYLPTGNQGTYTLGTIHVPEISQPEKWNTSTQNSQSKQQFVYMKVQKPGNYFTKPLYTYQYLIPEHLINKVENSPPGDNTKIKESQEIQYETVKAENQQTQEELQTVQNQHYRNNQQEPKNYQIAVLNHVSNKPLLSSNYQYFSIHPAIKSQDDDNSKLSAQENSFSYQKYNAVQQPESETKWIPRTVLYTRPQMQYLTQEQNNQQEKLQYDDMYTTYHMPQSFQAAEQKYQGQDQSQQEEMKYLQPTQLYLQHPSHKDEIQRQDYTENDSYSYPSEIELNKYINDYKQKHKRENYEGQHSETIVYGQISEHIDAKPLNPTALAQTNGHAGVIEPTTESIFRTNLPATTNRFDLTTTTEQTIQTKNITEVSSMRRKESKYQRTTTTTQLNNLDTTPETFTDRTFTRKTRRKGSGKRKNQHRENERDGSSNHRSS